VGGGSSKNEALGKKGKGFDSVSLAASSARMAPAGLEWVAEKAQPGVGKKKTGEKVAERRDRQSPRPKEARVGVGHELVRSHKD